MLRSNANSAYNSVALAVATTLIIIPATFALFDDDELRMSDDYAALVSAISLAVLLIAVVDIHFSVSKARALAASGQPLTAVAKRRRRGDRTYGDLIRDHMETLSVWLTTCAFLITSLALLTLWAAIEDHGPARWLAWYSFLAASYGLSVVVMAGVRKVIPEVQEVLDLVRAMPSDTPANPAGTAQEGSSPSTSP
ncbi:hypothetical protein SOM70_36545 [Streptomyces salinarius]|uniref:hypothetical protein n=1 Tax=Streptomyces salinarius TaxID=2762598 RepID=UPI0032DF11E3